MLEAAEQRDPPDPSLVGEPKQLQELLQQSKEENHRKEHVLRVIFTGEQSVVKVKRGVR